MICRHMSTFVGPAKRFIIALIFLISATAAAGVVEERAFFHKNNYLKFDIHQDFTPNGERQLAYEFKEIRKALPDSAYIVLYGRDLDGDSLIDTWFIPSTYGFERVIEKVSRFQDGWDVAESILKNDIFPQNRSLITVLSGTIPSFLGLSDTQYALHVGRVYLDQLDLLSFETKVKRMIRNKEVSEAEKLFLMQSIADGWMEQVKLIRSEDFKIRYTLLAAGVVYPIARVLFSFAPRVLSWATQKIGAGGLAAYAAIQKTQVGGVITRNLDIYIGQVQRVASRAALRYQKIRGTAATATLIRAQYLVQGGKEVGWRAASKGLAGSQAVNQMFKGAVHNWDFLMVSVAAVVTVEGARAMGKVYDDDPRRMLENLRQEKDLINNIAFISYDNFIQAGISTYFPLGKAWLICLFTSSVNSVIVNKLVKQETDAYKTAGDAGFQAIFGAGATQFDLRFRDYMREYAYTVGSPKLRHLGNVAVFAVDSTLLTGYSWATHKYSEHKEKSKAIQIDVGSLPKTEPAAVIPVYVPAS